MAEKSATVRVGMKDTTEGSQTHLRNFSTKVQITPSNQILDRVAVTSEVTSETQGLLGTVSHVGSFEGASGFS